MAEKKKLPSFVQMAKNFAGELTTYIASGAPNVEEENYKKRLDTCNKCEHLLKATMRCGKCGCLLEHKAKWKTTTCPLSKWDPEILSVEQKDSLEVIRKRSEQARLDAAKKKDDSKTGE